MAGSRKAGRALRAAAWFVAAFVVLGTPTARALPVGSQPASAPGIASAGSAVAASPGGRPNDYAADEILVRFDPVVPASVRQTVHAIRGNRAVRSFSLVPGLELVKLAPGAGVAQAVGAYSGMSAVRYAEPNQTYYLAAMPNDPYFGLLWGLNNTGQVYYSDGVTAYSGTADADIDAPEAWAVTTGSASVLVAVIDTGVDYTHPDLVANMWTNPGEIAGNGLDDDTNGYVDDVHGWNAVANNGNPMDDHGHGTHCAGTIGATGNNGIGVTGINRDVSIVAIKAGNADGEFSSSDMIEAMQYAHAIGADLTSNSYGGWGTFSPSLYDAIAATDSLFVVAAGNDGLDISGSFPGGLLDGEYVPPNSSLHLCPASYDLDNILAVGASDADDVMAGFSNYSSTKVDLFAPGDFIVSTVPGGYAYASGTSMATPHVAGVAALILSARPALDWAELKAAIMETVDPKAALTSYCVAGGRLNARAVNTPLPEADDDSYTTAEDSQLIVPAASGVLVGDTDPEGDALIASCDGSSGPSHGAVSLNADGSFTYTPNANYCGLDQFTYRAFDGSFYSDFATVTITVTPVNDPPSFTAGSDVTVAENSVAYSAVWATDISPGPLEPESVAFEVSSDNTALFSVQPAIGSTGTLTFTPAAATCGSALVSVTPRDAFGLAGGAETFRITVTPNTAPVLSAIGSKNVNELALLTFTASATDVDLPAQTLAFALDGVVPAGAAITAGGAFTWTPTEAQGPGTYPVTVVVSDGTLSDSEIITVTVGEVNTAPVLAAIGNRSVNELALLSFTASATDVDLPAQTLTYSFSGVVPAGAAITPGGVFTFTPTEAQGPGTYDVTVVVSDGTLTDSEIITVTVGEGADPVRVYRFYNGRLGTHFYTADEAEKASVQATLSHIYTYEGSAYSLNPANNTTPLYRFYKPSTGTHFYTASESEKSSVQATLAHLYAYEGPAYNVSADDGGGAKPMVWRFYNRLNGTHFYTADAAERDGVIASLSHIYSLDGAAFYLGQ